MLDRKGERVECWGCLPRPAEVGVLCAWCWGRLQSVVRTLPALVEHLVVMAVPSVSSPLGRSGGSGASRPGERMLFPGALVELDEVHAVLASWAGQVARDRGLRVPVAGTRWTVPDEDGEREPVGPASASGTVGLVEWIDPHLEWCAGQEWVGAMLADMRDCTGRALTRYPMEVGERRAEVACPSCGCETLLVVPPAAAGAEQVVRCRLPECGLVLGEAEWERLLAVAVDEARAGAGE